MLAYKQYVTVDDPTKVELTGLPFRKGQRIEVLILAEDEKQAERVSELRALFSKTQLLPQIQAISDEMIAEELEAYRAGR